MGALTWNSGEAKKLMGRDSDEVLNEPDIQKDMLVNGQEAEPTDAISDSEKKKKKKELLPLFIPDNEE